MVMVNQERGSGAQGSPQEIQLGSVPSEEAVGTLTVWLSYNFAPEWFQDALHEAKTGGDHHTRRREIVFAVCFAESYLVEWVRDEVLNRDFQRLNRYFPPGQIRSVTEKWKEVPKQLKTDGLIPAVPDLGQTYWRDWVNLVEIRNGLVHARSSRPETSLQPEKEKPFPSKGDLDQLPAGWATKVAITLVKRLHDAIGTTTPAWLVEP
jgi:hypothetical protein